ncbi:hypothetical protein BX616_009802 [Lobosporangium transversale]|nr:hypothetical protein BX616_009802 [Lobosporangium transversale]
METEQYISWALDNRSDKEHVSLPSFVKKFNFTNKESANEAYLSLITSTNIHHMRRKRLHGAYMAFKERCEERFWAIRDMKIADRMLIVKSATAAKKAGAIIQDSGLREVSFGHARYPSELKPDIISSEEMIDDSEDSESEVYTAVEATIPEPPAVTADVEDEASSTRILLEYPNISKRTDRGRKSTMPLEEEATKIQTFKIDPTSFINYRYHMGEVNIGKMFMELQVESLTVVNNLEAKATYGKLYKFLSMNYIWDLDVQLRNMPDETFAQILSDNAWPQSTLPNSTVDHCITLSEKLAQGMQLLGTEVLEEGLRPITLLFEILALKLPVTYRPFDEDIEDTYCHWVVDPIFTHQFPSKSRSIYRLDWAGKEADGSKERRGYGLKPDAIVRKREVELAFVEVKPPRGEHNTFLDAIDTDPTPRTPPRIELDDEQVERNDKGRPSKISPTKRDMF